MNPMESRLAPERHADIRALLVARAAAEPAVHPARPATRRAGLAVALTASAVAGTAVMLLAAQPDPPAGSGGWTAVPQAGPPLTASDDDIEHWASRCSDLGVGGVGIEGVPARREAADRREVLVDRRGGFTFCVDVSIGTGTATDPLIALAGIKEGDDGLNAMAATVSDKPFTLPGPADVLVLGGTLETPPSGGLEAYQLYGLSGPAVTGVDLVLPGGLRVTASLRGGIWGAWWPADRARPEGCRIEVHTAAGTTTVDPAAVRLPIG